MIVKKVNALKARQNLGRLLEEVFYNGDQFVIERAGRPMAAVVPVWQLEDREKRRQRLFGLVEGAWRRNRQVRRETIEEEVQAAVRSVRTAGKRVKR